MEPAPTRRDFLRRSAGAATTVGLLGPLGALAACSSSGTTDSATATTAPGSSGTVPAGEWDRLAAALEGELIRPGHAAYPDARVVFNTRFDDVFPAAVAACASTDDVRTAIRFAADTGVPLRPRNGRHSYAGYSTTEGLVLDLSRLDTVEVAGDGTTATIGGGALLVDVYAALTDRGVVLSAGSCPTVGVSGLALGGGIGLISRAHGTTSDNLRALEVVTAAGDVVTADADEHPDLFWACRGGGGGNFGVATRLVFDVAPADPVTTFQLTWGWDDAAGVLDAWQRWLSTLPDEVFTIAKVTTQDAAVGDTPVVIVFGQHLGPEDELRALLAPLLDPAVGTPATTEIAFQSMIDAIRLWAGCADLTVPQCREPNDGPEGQLSRVGFTAKSDFFADPLSPDGIAETLSWIERRQRDPALTGGGAAFAPGALQFDSFGGALNRPAADATAFVHRDAFSHGQYLAYWASGASPDAIEANLDWIRSFHGAMRPWASGFAYQNYIDPDLADWEQAYYGTNLGRLREVKRTYDPDGLFRFPQGIRPA